MTYPLRLNRRVLAIPLTVCAVFGVIAACVGDDPDVAGGGKNPGERGGPCNQGQCLVGLQCVDNICVAAGEAGGPDPGNDAGGGPPGQPDGSPSATDGGAPACKRNIGPFVPNINPTAPPRDAVCDSAEINTLVGAGCAPNLDSAPCQMARASGNPQCMNCIFSNRAQSTWGAMVIGPPSHPNLASCLDNRVAPDGGGPLRGCGVSYYLRGNCFQHFCESCTGSDLDACIANVRLNECQPLELQPPCATAINSAVLGGCNQPDASAAFETLARLQCIAR